MSPLFMQATYDTPSLQDRLFSCVKDPARLASIAVHNTFVVDPTWFQIRARFREQRTLLNEAKDYESVCANKGKQCTRILADILAKSTVANYHKWRKT